MSGPSAGPADYVASRHARPPRRAPDPMRDLARRREVLLARSARLRDELSDDTRAIGRRLGLVDGGVALLRSGLVLPVAIAGGVALLVGRPSRVLRFATKAVAFWPLVRPFVPQIAAFVRGMRAGARSPHRD